MKSAFIIIILIFTVYLFGQINFELDFSFFKIESNDRPVNIWLDDLNNDGISEIFVTYRTLLNNSWKLVQYDQNGDTLSVKNQSPQEDYIFHKGMVFNMDGSVYIAVTYKQQLLTSPNEWINYLHFKIYDWNTFSLVDSISYEIGNYYEDSGISFSTRFIKPIEFQTEQYIYLGLNVCEFNDDGVDGNYTYNTELKKFNFNNNDLTLIEEIEWGGNSLAIFDNFNNLITIDFWKHDWYHNEGIWSGKNVSYNLNKFSFYSPANIIEVFQISGSTSESQGYSTQSHFPSNIRFLNANDFNFNNYGLLFYYKTQDSDYGIRVNFRNFLPDMSDTLWTSNVTNIGVDNISASTCVNVNNENHYVMYFRENNLEVRDRISGDIIYNQYSSIIPFSIQRNSEGELLFFEENSDENGYDVYVLENEIQVSSDNALTIPLKFQFCNYPNPFNPTTTISFSVPEKSKVDLSIYNIKGQKIKSLVRESVESGKHSVIWNGVDSFGNSVSSGVYLYKLNVNGKTEAVKKCLLLK
ncbi:MAG: T9SS type A sorting domain-containing protein [Candidatus Cloacimonetes bacterium]|nr:T9SS type A sorting domain-containing protein [Candidatus Cloacimonadota bacterium]